MNNKEFINELSRRTGYTAASTQKMVNTVIDALGDAFQDGSPVSIDGFGNFEVRKKMERIMVNPTTQQRMLVPPKLVLAFRPADDWKDKVKNQTQG